MGHFMLQFGVEPGTLCIMAKPLGQASLTYFGYPTIDLWQLLSAATETILHYVKWNTTLQKQIDKQTKTNKQKQKTHNIPNNNNCRKGRTTSNRKQH